MTAPPHLRSLVSTWHTDWSRTSIPLTDLQGGGPGRDGIPPLDDPSFVSAQTASSDIAAAEPVVVFEHKGVARAYPLAILIWHEIVNDTVEGLPVTLTYCPLCNTAIAFDRRVAGQVLDFGTSGLLRHSDLVMWDRQTESLWQQVTGEALVGDMVGTHLEWLPTRILSFAEFRAAYPTGEVLARPGGFNRAYGSNPYEGYDAPGNSPFLFQGTPDPRLEAMERVVGLVLEEQAVVYPFSILAERGVINDEVAGVPVVVFYAPDALSALDHRDLAAARRVGSAAAYDPVVGGRRLEFEVQNGVIVDRATRSRWDVTGQAVAGSLAGTRLAVLPHANHFWFAFAAFYPDVLIRDP